MPLDPRQHRLRRGRQTESSGLSHHQSPLNTETCCSPRWTSSACKWQDRGLCLPSACALWAWQQSTRYESAAEPTPTGLFFNLPLTTQRSKSPRPTLQSRKCAMTSTLHCPLTTTRINLQGQEKGKPTGCGPNDRSCPWNTPAPGLPKASEVTQLHFTQQPTEAQKDFILWNPCTMSIL